MDYLVPAAATLLTGLISLIAICAAIPKPPKTPEAMKEAVINFVKGGYLLIRWNLKNPKPVESIHSFQSALGLCYQTYDPDRLTVSKNVLSYRYKLAPCDKLTPGLGTALMDEVTAGLMGSVGKAAGASLFFQTQWYPENIKIAPSSDEEEDYIDIVNTLTKSGRTIAHTRTDIRSSDNKLIGYSTHVKYLPLGNFFIDTFLDFCAPWMSPWMSKIINTQLPPPSATAHENIGAHKVVDAGLKFIGDGQGEFTMTDDHKNPFGTLHGGCTAMIIEKVGDSYAVSLFKDTSSIYLESIQVQFLSAGRGQNTLTIECDTIEFTENSHALVRVNIIKPGSGKRGPAILSQGVLKYVVA